VRPKVPMRRRGADCPVVVMKRGNARGAKGAGHRPLSMGQLGQTGRSPKAQRKAASQCIPQADPGRRVNPRFWHRLIRFRHFIDGSLALASLNRACRDHVPTFPQRSPSSLLTTAACGGLRSTPDCPTSKGPPSSLVQLRMAVWTGHARDTRPDSDIGIARIREARSRR
jgi:hypothetical protein